MPPHLPKPSDAPAQHTTQPDPAYCAREEMLDQMWGTLYGDPDGAGLTSRVNALEIKDVQRTADADRRGLWVRFWVPLLFTILSLVLATISIFVRAPK